jgi:hypothetical protein
MHTVRPQEESRCHKGTQNTTSFGKKINSYTIKWIQHVPRMDGCRLPNAILKYQQEGKRNPRRPLKKTSGLLYWDQSGPQCLDMPVWCLQNTVVPPYSWICYMSWGSQQWAAYNELPSRWPWCIFARLALSFSATNPRGTSEWTQSVPHSCAASVTGSSYMSNKIKIVEVNNENGSLDLWR